MALDNKRINQGQLVSEAGAGIGSRRTSVQTDFSIASILGPKHGRQLRHYTRNERSVNKVVKRTSCEVNFPQSAQIPRAGRPINSLIWTIWISTLSSLPHPAEAKCKNRLSHVNIRSFSSF